jgi:hypothetical protein
MPLAAIAAERPGIWKSRIYLAVFAIASSVLSLMHSSPAGFSLVGH